MDKGPHKVTKFNQTLNAANEYPGVRLRVLRFVVERERAQTNS